MAGFSQSTALPAAMAARGPCMMEFVRQRDVDRIDRRVSEQRLVITIGARVDGARNLGKELPGLLLAPATHRNKLCIINMFEARGKSMSDVPSTQNTPANHASSSRTVTPRAYRPSAAQYTKHPLENAPIAACAARLKATSGKTHACVVVAFQLLLF